MTVTKEEYRRMQKGASAHSPMVKNCIWAFAVGGSLCAAGEMMAEGLSRWLPLNDARMLSSVALMLFSMILTGIGVFDIIAKHAGAGTLVPITGFANAVVSPAIEFKSEGLVFGMAAKMFTVAGPVLVYGIAASALYGVVLNLMRIRGAM